LVYFVSVLTALPFSVTVGQADILKALPWPFYHSWNDTFTYLRMRSEECFKILSFEEHLDRSSGFRLPVITVTDSSVDESEKETLLLVFGEHGREIITTEISLWLVKLLTGDVAEILLWPAFKNMQAKNADNGRGEGGKMSAWIGHLLRRVTFKLVPVANIEGRRRVEAGDLCLRVKPNGVDLNRNYPLAFRSSPRRSADYGGPFPLSEPESRIIQSQARGKNRPRLYASVHSGEWALYIPWDSKKQRGERLPGDTERLLEAMNVHCRCMNGPAGLVSGYLALGSGMDYMYAMENVTYPLTLEVYGPRGLGTYAAGGHPRRLQRAAPGGRSLRCLEEFNPHTESLYQDTVSRWLGAILLAADFLGLCAGNRRPSAAPPLSSPSLARSLLWVCTCHLASPLAPLKKNSLRSAPYKAENHSDVATEEDEADRILSRHRKDVVSSLTKPAEAVNDIGKTVSGCLCLLVFVILLAAIQRLRLCCYKSSPSKRRDL